MAVWVNYGATTIWERWDGIFMGTVAVTFIIIFLSKKKKADREES